MYISQLKLWNFRKYGSETFNINTPNLDVLFNEGLNLLIGENDSGKSAIIDAIKLVLKAHAYEWIRAEDKDFYTNSENKISERLRIEIHFKGIKDDEAKNFIEWLGWEDEKIKTVDENGATSEETVKRPKLVLIYDVERKNGNIIPADIRAGMDGTGHILNAEAREYLKCTYLKPLRDAENELLAKKNSRLAKILSDHKLFKNANSDHPLIETFSRANNDVKNFFNNNDGDESNKRQIKDVIDEFLKEFIEEDYSSKFDVSPTDIKNILEKISLGIEGKNNLGLGTLNRIFMATELLHLRRNWNGLKLCVIEELEAHLHPQAQMKIIEKLKKESEEKNIQFILTTHSPNIASKVNLKSLIICKENDVFPMGEDFTILGDEIKTGKYKNSYEYLERFLDVTKSNLFFAKGIILVEGWSEEILIPKIAEKIGYDLTKQEISIINVGSTAFLHFAKIFLRNDGKKMKIPISIVTDLDEQEYIRERKKDENGLDIKIGKNYEYNYQKQSITEYEQKRNTKSSEIIDNNDEIKVFVSNQWTLEWCLLKSNALNIKFKEVIKKIHSDTFSTCTSEEEYEIALSKLLLSKSFHKTEIAYQLSDELKKIESLEIENEDTLSYLKDAIKHVCDYGNR